MADIEAVRADVQTALQRAHEVRAEEKLQHHPDLLHLLRSEINLPLALATLIHDIITRPDSDGFLGKDAQNWEVYGEVDENISSGNRILNLMRVRKGRIIGRGDRKVVRVCSMGIGGDNSIAGKNDAAFVSERCGKDVTYCHPYESSPRYVTELLEEAGGERDEALTKYIWGLYQQKEHILHDYLGMVVELGYAVLEATDNGHA